MRLIILLPLTLAGCQFVPGTNAAKIRAAEEAVLEKLSDPDSARFRNENAALPDLICGEVNARNRAGGYAGFTPFSYKPSTGFAVIISDDHSDASSDAILNFTCPFSKSR